MTRSRSSAVVQGLARPVALVALAFLVASAARAQVSADERAAAVVGVVCADLDEDGACTERDLPLDGVDVRLAGGLSARTDSRGRFHVAAAGAQSRALFADGADGVLLARPRTTVVTVDALALGPTARAPAPIFVELTPAAVVPVELAVKLPVRSAAVPPRVVGAPTAARLAEGSGALPLDVALAVAPDHVLLADGRPVVVDASGSATLRVDVAGRAASVLLVDRAPDGRTHLARLEILRVPRASGGDLVVVRPLRVLAAFDLPPANAPTPPGRLLVPVVAAPGTHVDVGGPSVRVGPSGRVYLWALTSPNAGALGANDGVNHSGADHGGLVLGARVDGASPRSCCARVDAGVLVDPMAALSATLAGEMRVGAVVGPVVGGALSPFAQGRVDGALSLPLFGGAIAMGASVDDDVATRALAGQLLLQRDRLGLFGRFPDPEQDLAVFGDASTTSSVNPGELALWAHARGPWGIAGLGTGRTGLDDAEVGRLDRPVLGPYLDVTVPLLGASSDGLRVGIEGGADAAYAPGVFSVPLAKAHVELDATGGSLYWLAHTDVAPASERIAIEVVDPLTFLVVDRRVLVRGVDYDIDFPSGRVLLAVPLGIAAASLAQPRAGLGAGIGAFGFGAQPRLVVDYAHAVGANDIATRDAAARLSLGLGRDLVSGLAALDIGASASSSTGGHSLVGVDVTAAPTPLLSLSASASRSRGALFGDAAANARSLDGGLSFVSSVPLSALPPPPGSGGVDGADLEGDAFAARARFGDARSYASAWVVGAGAGFVDGSGHDDVRRALGADGRVELFGASALSAVVSGRETRLRQQLDVAARAEGWIDLALGEPFAARAASPDGQGGLRLRLAVDGLYRRALALEVGYGDATAVGGEVGVRLNRRLEVFVGHLQAVARAGDVVADPTLTSAGARWQLSPGRLLDVRAGVHPDLRPEASATVLVDDEGAERSGGRTSRYGGFAVTSDGPFSGAPSGHAGSLSSVSGVRQSLGPNAVLYSEQRTGSLDDGADAHRGRQRALSSSRIVGAEGGQGPFLVRLAYETGERAIDVDTLAPVGATARHALTGRAGLALPRLQAHLLGELTSLAAPDPPDGLPLGGDASQWVLGAIVNAAPLPSLSVGGRVLVSRGQPVDDTFPDRAGAEALVGIAWRPTGLPAAFVQYSVREDATSTTSRARLQVVRASLAFGALPQPQLVLSGEGAHRELLTVTDAIEAQAQALVVDARLGWPLWIFEPAIEVGARAVLGAVEPELDMTARVEAALRLGPAAIGLGVVVAGYTGEGLDVLTLQPAAPPVYLVIRGGFG